MYKYFMGKESNIDTRKDDMPIVIRGDAKTCDAIDKWLIQYAIEFDFFIESLKNIVKQDIRSIDYEINNRFIFVLADCTLGYLEFLSTEAKSPELILSFDDKQYKINLGDKNIIKSIYEEIDEVKYCVEYYPISQKIVITILPIVISIEFDGEDRDVYDTIKNNIDALLSCESIQQLFCYLIEIFHDKRNIAFYFSNMKTYQFTRFDVNDLKINKYVFIQYDFMYEYSSNGNWNACVGNFIVNYNSSTRRKITSLRRSKFVSRYSFKEVMDDTDKVIGMMKETVDKLNAFIQ